jgi:hypothetical protein
MSGLKSGRILARGKNVVKNRNDWPAAVINVSKVHLSTRKGNLILTGVGQPLAVSKQFYAAMIGSDSVLYLRDIESR